MSNSSNLIQLKKSILSFCIFSLSLSAMENTVVEHKKEITEQIVKSIVPHNKKQNLLIIRGTANSGKSSLCREICNLDNSYIIVSEDDINRKMTYEICENLFPTEMATIHETIKYENRWRAIKCFDLLFKEETNEQNKQCTIDAITCIRNFFNNPEQEKQAQAARTITQYTVMQQLLFYTACGYNVILDAWGRTNWNDKVEELKPYFNQKIRVTTYCSLTTVFNRWNKRNENAIKTTNLTDKRTFRQMLESFFNFLQPAINDTNSLIVTKKEFDSLIDNAPHYTNLNNNKHLKGNFSFGEFTIKDLADFKEKTYAKFDFIHKDQVYLTPPIPYDILLCTEGDCNNYAQELLQRLI